MKQEHRGREAQESPGFNRGDEVKALAGVGLARRHDKKVV